LDDGRVVKETVEHRCGDGGVLEDLPPAGDVPVGRQDDRAALVAAARAVFFGGDRRVRSALSV